MGTRFSSQNNYLLLLLLFCADLAVSFLEDEALEDLEVEDLLELHPHVIIFLLIC